MTKDSDCITFLQWALPKLKLRWPGFRKVRGQVCKRLRRRLQVLELDDLAAYQGYLETHPDEWAILDAFCRISISRFYRDHAVFDQLTQMVLPALAETVSRRGEPMLRCRSIGCASGEEPYTLNMIWQFVIQSQFPNLQLHITAIDADAGMLQRAQVGCYPRSSLKELPEDWRNQAFEPSNTNYCLKPRYQAGIHFVQQDIRQTQPDEAFHLILCRNSVLTYFDEALQKQVLANIVSHLTDGGGLVVGEHERLPDEHIGLEDWLPNLGIYRKAGFVNDK